MRERSPTFPIMDRGRTSEYFKIGSGRTSMQEQAGSTGDEPRANVVKTQNQPGVRHERL